MLSEESQKKYSPYSAKLVVKALDLIIVAQTAEIDNQKLREYLDYYDREDLDMERLEELYRADAVTLPWFTLSLRQ